MQHFKFAVRFRYLPKNHSPKKIINNCRFSVEDTVVTEFQHAHRFMSLNSSSIVEYLCERSKVHSTIENKLKDITGTKRTKAWKLKK